MKARRRLIDLTAWKPRDYQRPVWDALHGGCKRVVAVWHRRAGKDSTFLHWTVEEALRRPGIYYHMLPTAVQARRVIWDGRTREGVPFLDAWPKDRIVGRREDEMKLTLDNGSIWQCVGSDKYDSLVGTNPVGVVFSEYAIGDPRAWDFIRPILAENDGWACFPYTPRVRNHGWSLYQMARNNEAWHAELLTVDDTGFPLAKVEKERRDGMPEELIQQEFYCSFDAPLTGAIYGEQMSAALKDERIMRVPYQHNLAVHTWWDLGKSDATAIWFVQYSGPEVHIVDYYEASGPDLPFYASVLQDKQREHKIVWGEHVWPHDGDHVRLGMGGQSMAKQFGELSFHPRVQPITQDIWHDIAQVRSKFSTLWFDAERCERGIEALRSYSKEEDLNRSTKMRRFFRDKPRHDWASHAADALRCGVVAGRQDKKRRGPTPVPEIVRRVV